MSTATLNGYRVVSARVTIPAWGAWYAEAQLDTEQTLSGRVTLKVADLELVGTVLSGGPSQGRSAFRVAAGAGAWGKSIAAQGYANDAGVKVSTVLGDAARLAGETLAPIDAALRVGPAWTRQAGPASRDLELIAPRAWYVDEAGVTRLGKRPTGTLDAKTTRVTPVDKARGKVVLAPTSIATLLPGVVVDGMEAVDVLHEIDADAGLRSTVWGARVGSTLDSLRALLAQLDPDREFRGVVEYRVVTAAGHRLNLQPVRVSSGMPSLSRVPVRPGVSGCEAEVALGSRVLVTFVDADPARPVVVAFDDAEAGGFKPVLLSIDATTVLKLADGIRPMAATGDIAGGIWPIVGTTRVMG